MEDNRYVGIMVRGGIGDYLSFTTYYDAIKEKYPNHKKKIVHYQLGAFQGLGEIVRDLFNDLDPGMSEYMFINAKPGKKFWSNVIVSELIPTVFDMSKTDHIYTFINGRPSEQLERSNIKLKYGKRPKILSNDKQNVILHRHSGVSYKNPSEWGMNQDFWTDLERRLVEKGNNVFVIGGKDDSFRKDVPGVNYMCGKITVRECATLIKHADCYFGQATWSAIPASENCRKVMIYHPDGKPSFGPGSSQNLFICFHLNLDKIFFLPKSAVNTGVVLRWFNSYNEVELLIPFGLREINSGKKLPPPPKIVDRKENERKSKSVIQSVDTLEENSEVYVCKRYGGMGDHFFLNYTWKNLARINGKKILIVDDLYAPMAKDAGFDKIYTLGEVVDIHDERIHDNEPVMSEVKRRFEGAVIKNVFINTDEVERKELMEHGAVRSDRPLIWSRNIGIDNISFSHTYNITNAEKTDARKILSAIFPVLSNTRKRPLIGIAPMGTTQHDIIRDYVKLCDSLYKAGYNILVLHHENLSIPNTRQIPQLSNRRMLPAIAEQLKCIVTVDSGWLCVAALVKVPTVAIMGWGAGRLICKYSEMVEPIYPKIFHSYSCPCRRKGFREDCLDSSRRVKCTDVEINRIIAAVRNATYNISSVRNTGIGLIGNNLDEIIYAADKITKAHRRKINLILTTPDKELRNKIRSGVRGRSGITSIIDIPTIDGTSNDRRVHELLAAKRNHVYYEASYIDLELPILGE